MNTLLDVFLVGSLPSLEETLQVLAGRFADLGADGDGPGPDSQHTHCVTHAVPSAPR